MLHAARRRHFFVPATIMVVGYVPLKGTWMLRYLTGVGLCLHGWYGTRRYTLISACSSLCSLLLLTFCHHSSKGSYLYCEWPMIAYCLGQTFWPWNTATLIGCLCKVAYSEAHCPLQVSPVKPGGCVCQVGRDIKMGVQLFPHGFWLDYKME